MLKKVLLNTVTIIAVTFMIIVTIGCKKDEAIVQEVNFNPSIKYGSLKDQDGNTYKTVTIGTQVWMAENLKTTKYRSGVSITNITDHNQWVKATTGAYCNYSNDKNKADTYGRLYNWYAVNDSSNIAPEGWHVATDTEWATLISYLGGDSVAGPKLKETGNKHWLNFNEIYTATNESGFTALPGGIRIDIFLGGTFFSLCLSGKWWSSTQYSTTRSWSRVIDSENDIVGRSSDIKFYGYSVRCVKD